MTDEPRIPRRWRRPLFFAVSGAVIVSVIVAASPVMLPFILALVIAFVLTPPVAAIEKRKVPRVAAIGIVYAMVLGSLYLFVSLSAPRLGTELIGLRRELPVLANQMRDQWVPFATEKLHAMGLMPTGPRAQKAEEAPAIIVRPQQDGSFAVDVGTGVEVVPAHGGYLVREAKELQDRGGFDLNRLIGDALGKSVAYVQHNALELARIGRDIVTAFSKGVFIFFITLMLAAYLMITRERVMGFFTSLVRPSRRGDWSALLVRVNGGLSGVVRGQLVICLINGVLSAVGFAIVGLKYWPVLALVSTVMSLIPIFGSIASAVPAVALGLTQSFGTAAFVLAWIVGIHQLEANVLNPKIMGDSAKIHPVLVIFSLLTGEHFFHVTGALLAVPAMSVVQSLFLHFRDVVNREDPEFREAAASRPLDTQTSPLSSAGDGERT